jgi:hypothetical protein
MDQNCKIPDIIRELENMEHHDDKRHWEAIVLTYCYGSFCTLYLK